MYQFCVFFKLHLLISLLRFPRERKVKFTLENSGKLLATWVGASRSSGHASCYARVASRLPSGYVVVIDNSVTAAALGHLATDFCCLTCRVFAAPPGGQRGALLLFILTPC